MELKEEWRPVVGYEGLYEVSNFGRVASLNYKLTGKRKLMKLGKSKAGYLIVHLKSNLKKVHRLVGMAFPEICGTYSEGLEIDHINGIRDDNRAENLRWCTTKENCNNPITLNRYKGRQSYLKGKHLSEETKNKMSEALKGKYINRKDLSKPVLQYGKDGTFIAEYQSLSEAQRQTGINFKDISRCCLKKPHNKSAGGFCWKYKEIEREA